MKEKLKDLITEKCDLSNNHCGIHPNEICNILEISFSDLKPLLNELYIEKFIRVIDGVCGKMIFKATN